MGQTVYVDLLFLVNFSMDFLCFFVTARLLCRPFKVWRSVLAASMGGIYSIAVLFINMNPILVLVSDLGFCALMCLCAYGIKDKRLGEFLLHTTVYFGVSIGTGGCMTAMYSLLNRIELPFGEVNKNPDGISVWIFGILAIVSGFFALWGGKIFKSTAENDPYEVEITYHGASLTLTGMVDTGNMLRDPISGKPIVIVEKKSLLGLLDENTINKAIRGNFSGVVSDDYSHKARMVVMHTVAGNSMLCAFVPEKITLRNKKQKNTKEADALFAPGELSFGADKAVQGCVALIPGELVY